MIFNSSELKTLVIKKCDSQMKIENSCLFTFVQRCLRAVHGSLAAVSSVHWSGRTTIAWSAVVAGDGAILKKI